MGFFERIFGIGRQRERLRPLYRAVVEEARDPRWYLEGAVPDSIDGRFDMIAAVLSLAFIRLEREPDREAPTLLAEIFIDDMEASLREIGIGDLVVGKHVGRMVGALGGRLSAFRAAIAQGGDFSAPVRRNIFHESPPSPEALAFVASRLSDLHAALAATPARDLLAGRLSGRLAGA